MNEEISYSDTLVERNNGTILFCTYSFPFGKKRIAWSGIGRIKIKQPTVLNGKYRIHGSGDFRTWFPRDGKRPTRDRIFIMTLRNTRRQVGFTVEDFEKFILVSKSKRLIKNC